MLYITTRSKYDAFTPFRTLGANRGPDDGLFVPFQMPTLDQAYMEGLKDRTFGQNVADILNLFYSARMDGWDVDFCIGRYPAKLVHMSHRIVIAEAWHNPDHDFARIVHNLSSRIRGTEDTADQPTNWAWISTRIAMLFGIFGELCKQNIAGPDVLIDVAMPAGDFAGPMAAWYAREMGLPIANIICACDENDAGWELLRHGEMATNGGANIPSDLERLICATLGIGETKRFLNQVEKKRVYLPPEDSLETLRNGMFPAVISWKRRENIINSVYRTSTYILDPGSAMAYGGLQDYRATAGEARPALIWTERGPICSAETVAGAMGISVQALKERLNMA